MLIPNWIPRNCINVHSTLLIELVLSSISTNKKNQFSIEDENLLDSDKPLIEKKTYNKKKEKWAYRKIVLNRKGNGNGFKYY